jgi:hypothetical protein
MSVAQLAGYTVCTVLVLYYTVLYITVLYCYFTVYYTVPSWRSQLLTLLFPYKFLKNKGNIPVASEKGNTLYVLQYDTFPPLMIYNAYGTNEEIFRSTS